MQGQFIDLILLRPCNLKHLPVMEPAPIQLGRLVRFELQPIRNFQDWSEAWAVHGAVIANKCPEKAADQFSYFLLLASAQRDIPGIGWLDYDVAFRKHAADKDSVCWGEVMPTLWMTTILSKGALPPRVTYSKPQLPCLRWNAGSCTCNPCKFLHCCQFCKGPHFKFVCPRNTSPTSQACPQPVVKHESSFPSKRSRK